LKSLSATLKPSGSTSHSLIPVATQVRPMLPVLGGISGWKRTICRTGSYINFGGQGGGSLFGGWRRGYDGFARAPIVPLRALFGQIPYFDVPQKRYRSP